MNAVGLMTAWLVVLLVLSSVGEASFTLLLAGDVNLNPNVTAADGFSYVWGTMKPVLQSADLLAFNHESTLAGIQTDANVIQFEDPLHYLETYADIGVDLIVQANNHEFDFGYAGLQTTMETLDKLGMAWTGLAKTPEEVRRPRVIRAPDGTEVAVFTVVVDECWLWPNGTHYLDACTCGSNAGPPPAYQCYEAGSDGVPAGLWYYWAPSITAPVIDDITSVVSSYKAQHEQQLVVVYLHAGPNFQWHPYAGHEQLLRNISQAADLVWGTSAHHIQRFEIWHDTPIIYGMGDLLFRHEVGVVDFCPLYAVPCEAYRPDLALNYKFTISNRTGAPRVDLDTIVAFPSSHTDQQTFLVSDPDELHWIESIFNAVSTPLKCSYNATLGGFNVLGAQN